MALTSNLTRARNTRYLELARAEQNLASTSHIGRGAPVELAGSGSGAGAGMAAAAPGKENVDVGKGEGKRLIADVQAGKVSPARRPSPVRTAGREADPGMEVEGDTPRNAAEAPSVLPRINTSEIGLMSLAAKRSRLEASAGDE